MKKLLPTVLAALIMSPTAWGASITVTSPVAGANWYIGSPYTITWTKSETMPPTVAIRLRQGNQVWDIAPSTANDGAFENWVIPDSIPAGDYTVRVRTNNPNVIGDSGTVHIGNKRIVLPFIPRDTTTITVNAVGGEFYRFFGLVRIVWDRTWIEAYAVVYIYLRLPDGSIGWRDAAYIIAPNTKDVSAPGSLCTSGNCGQYFLKLPKSSILPSPNGQYYIDIFTEDIKKRGKSALFYLN